MKTTGMAGHPEASFFLFRYRRISPLSNHWKLTYEGQAAARNHLRPGALRVLEAPKGQCHRLFQVGVAIPHQGDGQVDAQVFDKCKQLADGALRARYPFAKLSDPDGLNELARRVPCGGTPTLVRRIQAV
jgi:hypothetical protein